jgi:integrase
MPDTSYLLQRRKCWYVRVAVPAELRHKVGGKREIVRSLKTRHLKEAQRLRFKAIAEIKSDLERLRTGSEIVDDALQWSISREETKQANMQAFGYDEEQAEDLAAIDAEEKAEKLERDHGASVAQRWHEVATGKGLPISVAMERWLEQSTSSDKTKAEQRKAVEEFLAFAGDQLAHKVTRRMAGLYVDHLRQQRGRKDEPAKPATINKKLSALSSLWRHMRRRGWVEENPFHDQSLAVPKSKKRPYTWAEVKALLDNPKATPLLRDALILGLYTGARQEDIASLRAEDVEANGFWITDGKTDANKRWVPLEGPALEVVQRRTRGVSEGWVFTELEAGAWGKRAGAFSKRYARLRDRVLGEGMGEQVDFHSLRRTYSTVAENVADVTLHSRLMGHEAPTLATGVYSGGAWLERLRDAQRQIATTITDRLEKGRDTYR